MHSLHLAISGSERDEEVSAPHSTESQLVKRALNGDDDAFGKIIESYQGQITIQMRRFSSDRTVQEELVHDVFVEAYMSLKSYRANAPFIHWLRKIAVRVGYRFWKRKKKISENAMSLSSLENIEEAAELVNTPNAASELLESLLELLSTRNRLVLTLLYWDGYSVVEAAELTGWSTAMVKVQAFRARKRLKKLIEEAKT